MKKDIYAQQRNAIVREWQSREKQLQEYGVPGMKWGVRNPSTRLSGVKANKLGIKYGIMISPDNVGEKGRRAMIKSVALSDLATKVGDRLQNAKTDLGIKRLMALQKSADKNAHSLYNAVWNKSKKIGYTPKELKRIVARDKKNMTRGDYYGYNRRDERANTEYDKQRAAIVSEFKERERELKEGGPGSGRRPGWAGADARIGKMKIKDKKVATKPFAGSVATKFGDRKMYPYHRASAAGLKNSGKNFMVAKGAQRGFHNAKTQLGKDRLAKTYAKYKVKADVGLRKALRLPKNAGIGW